MGRMTSKYLKIGLLESQKDHHFKEIEKTKNKNEQNSSITTGFLLVTLREVEANRLVTKRSLIMRFGCMVGVGGVFMTKMAKNDHLQRKCYKLLKSLI